MMRYLLLLLIVIHGSITLRAQQDSMVVRIGNKSTMYPIVHKGVQQIENGKLTAYYQFDTSKVARVESYYLGKQSGVTKSFYPNGQLMEAIVFQNGMRNGDYTFYDTLGIISTKARYRNNRKHGFFIDNLTKCQGKYFNDQRNGKWEFEVGTPDFYKEYYRHGIQIEKRQIFPSLNLNKKKAAVEREEKINPKIDSLRIPFNGEVKWYKLRYVDRDSLTHPAMRKAYFKEYPAVIAHTKYVYNGYVNGIYKIYYPNGKLYRFLNYTAGYLDGLWKEYDQMGEIKIKGKYKDGLKVGKWEYNLNTKEYYKEIYRNGNKIK